jgi:hypothetical protein
MTKKKNPEDLLPRGRPRIDGTAPTTQRNDAMTWLQFSLTASQKQWFLAEAERKGISASEMFRRWIEEKRK